MGETPPSVTIDRRVQYSQQDVVDVNIVVSPAVARELAAALVQATDRAEEPIPATEVAGG